MMTDWQLNYRGMRRNMRLASQIIHHLHCKAKRDDEQLYWSGIAGSYFAQLESACTLTEKQKRSLLMLSTYGLERSARLVRLVDYSHGRKRQLQPSDFTEHRANMIKWFGELVDRFDTDPDLPPSYRARIERARALAAAPR